MVVATSGIIFCQDKNTPLFFGEKFIIEYSTKDFNIDPSFGSHFFQNVTSMRIGYFTINHKKKTDKIDIDWINTQPVKKKTKYIK